MSALQLKIEVTGVEQTKEALARVENVLSNLQPEMETVGNYLMAFFSQDVFETEGQVYGEQWARLNAKYEEWKATHYPGRGVLEASGKMRYAFQLMTTSTYALIQNPTEYAKFHMTGTSHMPARVFMKIDEQRAEEVVKKIKEGIQQRIGESLL